MKDEIKDELIFIICSKLNLSKKSTRNIIKDFPFLNSMIINRIVKYNVEDLKVDKLIEVINNIDLKIHNKVFGFTMDFDFKKQIINFRYLGDIPN